MKEIIIGKQVVEATKIMVAQAVTWLKVGWTSIMRTGHTLQKLSTASTESMRG